MNNTVTQDFARCANDNRGENDNRSHPGWQRSNLDDWRQSLSDARRQQDAKKLSRLFNVAAKVPELRDALDWAAAHGIEFIVDHTVEASGYYPTGSGVVAISAKCFGKDDGDLSAEAVATAVHEIRHAWQDYHGMMPAVAKSFAGLVLRLSLMEADATAHGKLAVDQYKQYLAGAEAKPSSRQEEAVQLWNSFKNWYGTEAPYYNEMAMSLYAAKFGIAGAAPPPDINYEYEPEKNPNRPKTEGLDVTRFQLVRSLGKGFRGGNYFDAADRDLLLREVLSAGRAAALYSTGSTPPVAAQIRQHELRRKWARKAPAA